MSPGRKPSLSPASTAGLARMMRLTSASSPSRVSTLPRRNRSQPRRPSSSRRTESSEPASSAAIVLSRVSWRRAKSLPGEALADHRADPLAVRAAGDPRHRHAHHLAHVSGLGGSGRGDCGVDDPSELVIGHLLRQIALDLAGLGLLGLGAVGATALAVGLGRLEPALALAPQDRDLVVAPALDVL